MRTTSSELLIEVDRSRPRGLRAQIEGQLRDAIRTGRLGAGTPLPATRTLATDLGVTRGVVVAAYDQLLAEGYLAARRGSATVVNATAATAATSPQPGPSVVDAVVDFRTALPDLSLFPRAAWLRATRAAMQSLPDEHLGYADPRGLPQLRTAVADYLGRVRGVTADADQVVICNGFGHGLSLLAPVLRAAGCELFATEDPGHQAPRAELDWLGVPHCGVPVDDDGVVVDRVRQSGARVVLVTPAHQYPTGAVLAPSRRQALVRWAAAVDGYVVEDDYDAEYRYGSHPVGAMQGLAPERVIYSGTLSKSLAPGLRLGWLVLPRPLVEPLATSRLRTDYATSSHLQATCAAFLANGDLDRHLRRTRRVYRQRRDVLIAALARWLPHATVDGVAAGLHVVVTLPPGLDEELLTEHAADAGVRVYPLGRYRRIARPGAPPALVLGYGSLRPRTIEEGIRRLADAAAAASETGGSDRPQTLVSRSGITSHH
jgi:GntR family transcriptional regulator/MocR family aminotransferase